MLIPSHGGPWRRVGTGPIHCYPAFGPKHNRDWHCWCHPIIEIFEDGEMVLHNVAQ
jgi:hypothetical protein